jgi:hypothetical protein
MKKFQSSRTFVSSPVSNMSPKGIATVVLSNKQTDNKAGGSGAAGQWSGQLHGRVAYPQEMQGNI